MSTAGGLTAGHFHLIRSVLHHSVPHSSSFIHLLYPQFLGTIKLQQQQINLLNRSNKFIITADSSQQSWTILPARHNNLTKAWQWFPRDGSTTTTLPIISPQSYYVMNVTHANGYYNLLFPSSSNSHPTTTPNMPSNSMTTFFHTCSSSCCIWNCRHSQSNYQISASRSNSRALSHPISFHVWIPFDHLL